MMVVMTGMVTVMKVVVLGMMMMMKMMLVVAMMMVMIDHLSWTERKICMCGVKGSEEVAE